MAWASAARVADQTDGASKFIRGPIGDSAAEAPIFQKTKDHGTPPNLRRDAQGRPPSCWSAFSFRSGGA